MKYVLSILIISSFVFTLQAQDYWLSKCHMTISGTSTLHEWTSDVTKVWGNATMSTGSGSLDGISKLSVEMDVYSIKSSKGSMMDNNTHNALKAKQFPKISFIFSKLNTIKKNGNEYAINASGNLTLGGQTKPMTLTVTGKMNGDGTITFTGSKSFKMSEYGIEPPTFMMGSLKTGDEVTINFSATYSR